MPKIPVTLTLHLFYEFEDDDASEDKIKFHLEENYCVDNFIEELATEIENNADYCTTCSRATVRVGHFEPGDIEKKTKIQIH